MGWFAPGRFDLCRCDASAADTPTTEAQISPVSIGVRGSALVNVDRESCDRPSSPHTCCRSSAHSRRQSPYPVIQSPPREAGMAQWSRAACRPQQAALEFNRSRRSMGDLARVHYHLTCSALNRTSYNSILMVGILAAASRKSRKIGVGWLGLIPISDRVETVGAVVGNGHASMVCLTYAGVRHGLSACHRYR